MTVIGIHETEMTTKIDATCRRIAPLWPLKSFVAVNPYFGLSDEPFWEADRILRRISGVGLCMPRTYYEGEIASGRITPEDLVAALGEVGVSWELSALKQALARPAPVPGAPLALLTDVLGSVDGTDWSDFVVDRISHYCAAYFDEGQAMWKMPWSDKSLYQGWVEYARIDKSLSMMGVRGMGKAAAALPETADEAIRWALGELGVPAAVLDDYLHAALLSVGGWAGWTRYRRWQAELKNGQDNSIRDLLAIRLAWDALLYKLRYSDALKTLWDQAMTTLADGALGYPNFERELDAVLQTAFEIGYQRQLLGTLSSGSSTAQQSPVGTAVQAVFCIDVRSEVYRRALEKVTPQVQTLGFAGFFGVLVEYRPFGSVEAKGHLPILFNPSYQICERPYGDDEAEASRLMARRHTRMRAASAWMNFKTSASSCFSFVEAAGVLSAHKLLSDSMGWSRPVAHPDRKGLDAVRLGRLRPRLSPSETGACGAEEEGLNGIPEADRPAVAEFALRNMSMIGDFARLVLLVGHGSSTVNNPQATALDCGACAGQTGEVSARITVTLLNDPVTRAGLAEKGIVIPTDTHFIAGLHDTTTDEVQLFDSEDVPTSHAADLSRLRRWLAAAGQLARVERAALLGTADLAATEIEADMWRRTRDWAEVRPEWALAGNAAFIVAPRTRTAGCDLAGRAFLHEYNWRNDVNFNTLELIMTAPMVVGNWINMQYYGSVVDNRHYGSGNKVLHNVAGGSVGVLEGNGGDLRVGLAMQSLHDGTRWIHEPMRLNVVVEAPESAIDAIIERHEMVRQLIENTWLYFLRIDEDGSIYRRRADRQWLQVAA